MGPDVTFIDLAVRSFDNIGSGGFAYSADGCGDANDSSVHNLRVVSQGGLNFGWGDLPSADFDHLLLGISQRIWGNLGKFAKETEAVYLFAVDNVDFAMLFIAEVTRLKPTLGIYRSTACFGVPEISLHNGGPSDADLGWILE